jgi:hypothetical protein
MDANFLYWLRLTLKSTENIAHIRSDVHALFEKKDITATDFSTGDLHLRNKLQSIAYRCPEIRMIVPPRTAYKQQGPDDSRKHTRIVKLLQAVRYYSMFLGYQHTLVSDFVDKVQARSQRLQQGLVGRSLQDPLSTYLITYVRIIHVLVERQKLIDARILRFLNARNLAESSWTLRDFGMYELRPFIEICLRYTVVPRASHFVTNLRRPTRTNTSDNLDDRFAEDADNVMGSNSLHAATLVYLKQSPWMAQVERVSANKRPTLSKLVTTEIYEELSMYIFFYMQYCALDRQADENKREPLFAGKLGGGWDKTFLGDIRKYATYTDLPVAGMGLDTVPTTSTQEHGYIYTSKLLWLVARTHTQRVDTGDIDTVKLAADAAAVSIAFAQENKYYTLLQNLRDINVSRAIFNRDGKGAPISIRMCLAPMPVLMRQQLTVELSAINDVRIGFLPYDTPTDVRHELWSDIAINDELYSTEYRLNMGKSSSVAAFLHHRRADKRTGGTQLPPPRTHHSRQHHIPSRFENYVLDEESSSSGSSSEESLESDYV